MYAFRSDWQPAPGCTPRGTTLLAVGDVHGCFAHFEAMLDRLGRIVEQVAADGRRCELVLLGDYADRGPDSLGVLRALGGIPARLGVPVHRLLGNHDQLLDQAARLMPDPELMALWCENGGHTVLAECGLDLNELDGADPAAIAATLRARLGPPLLRLLRELAPCWRSGGYLFVHAGIDPTRPLEANSLTDLLWLREPFLTGAGWSHPFAVVHGHTPCGPQLRPHRIAVDSGSLPLNHLSDYNL